MKKNLILASATLLASICYGGEAASPPPVPIKEFDPPRLTIAMWDYSWLNGHHRGGWAEDFDKVTDELIERKFNTVRIDAFPLIIHDLVQKGETEYLIKANPHANWGFSLIEHRQDVAAELRNFMAITKRKGLRVILSSWGIGRNDSHADPARFRAAWETTLDVLEKDGLLDHVVYVDFDQEFPYFSPFQKQLNQLGKVKMPDPGGQAGAMEQAGSGGGAWNVAQRAFVKDYFESTLAHFHRKYPKLRFTFSLTGFWPEVRSLKVQGLDVLELHVWIRNQLNDFTDFNRIQKDRKPDRDYKKYMAGIRKAMEHREELTAHMKSQMATARDWAAELGVPLTTTEAWGPWWHMDHPDLEWQWLADWCEACMAIAPEYGFRGVTPWNYSHPYWENWKNIEWYRRINGRFLAGATDTTKQKFSPAVGLIHGTEFHVSPGGNDDGTGAKNAPFRTIQHTANLARPGDTITVHEGVYRERVNPPRGGTSNDNRIVYQAAPGEKVVIKGSEPVKGWVKEKHDTWRAAIPNNLFGGFNPYADVIGGEWYDLPNDKFNRHTGAVYLNEDWLTEAKTLDSVLQPAGEEALWFAGVDAENTTIRAQFKGVDPNKENVEINVRQSIFYPSEPGRNFITVRGFTMRQAATPWAGAMSGQIGLIGTHWSKGWIIESNTICHSMNTGITLGRYDLGRHNIAMPPATAPGFVTSCELALQHGWSKETIGSHLVRGNHISHCNKNGIHGSLGGIFSTIEGNTIHDIGLRGWVNGPDIAGLKLLGSVDTIIRNNHIYRCGSSGGIWLDWMAQGTRVTGNLLHDNTWDLFMEVDHGPFLIDHNLMLSGKAIRDWSQGGAYAHNLIMGKSEGRTETRQTPWFTPHTVENMRISDITKTDFRFYNNLFAGGNGSSSFHAWASKLQAGGNVYLADAKPCAGETEAVLNPDFNPDVKLTEGPDGEWWLEMAVDPAWLTAQSRPLVTTEQLGTAVVPSQHFEQPDGKPYRLDTDYAGVARNANPAPGPFDFTTGEKIHRKVWPSGLTPPPHTK